MNDQVRTRGMVLPENLGISPVKKACGTAARVASPGTSWKPRGSLLLIGLVAVAMMLSAETASAWCWRPRAIAYGCGWRPWCGPRVVTTYGCSSYSYFGYGYGYRYGYGYGYGWNAGCGQSWPGVGFCGPGFYSGIAYPAVVYGWYPGGLSVGWGFSGYGCGPLGLYGWGPFAQTTSPAATAGGLNISALAAGSTRPAAVSAPAATPLLAGIRAGREQPRQGALAAGPGRPASRSPLAAAPRPLTSSTAARMRAGRHVAAGDDHLRAGVEDERRLAEALRAYDQAARIAADLPDTHLRRAIVLSAMGRTDDARSAVGRAAAIDARLADTRPDEPRPAVAGGPTTPLPPDPIFGESAPAAGRPGGGRTALDARTDSLLARIFRFSAGGEGQGPGGLAGHNWIAARWQARDGQSAPAGSEARASRLAAR